jgi:hypothetical protein
VRAVARRARLRAAARRGDGGAARRDAVRGSRGGSGSRGNGSGSGSGSRGSGNGNASGSRSGHVVRAVHVVCARCNAAPPARAARRGEPRRGAAAAAGCRGSGACTVAALRAVRAAQPRRAARRALQCVTRRWQLRRGAGGAPETGLSAASTDGGAAPRGDA